MAVTKPLTLWYLIGTGMTCPSFQTSERSCRPVRGLPNADSDGDYVPDKEIKEQRNAREVNNDRRMKENEAKQVEPGKSTIVKRTVQRARFVHFDNTIMCKEQRTVLCGRQSQMFWSAFPWSNRPVLYSMYGDAASARKGVTATVI